MRSTRQQIDADIIEAVTALHEIGTPIALIATRVTLTLATVPFVLQRGRLPQQRATLSRESGR